MRPRAGRSASAAAELGRSKISERLLKHLRDGGMTFEIVMRLHAVGAAVAQENLFGDVVNKRKHIQVACQLVGRPPHRAHGAEAYRLRIPD